MKLKLRTEVETEKRDKLSLSLKGVTIGSCFSNAIGTRLANSGLDIAVNPMGVLFNPLSIASAVHRALKRKVFHKKDLWCDDEGIYHALAFESRRRHEDATVLLETLNADFSNFATRLETGSLWIVTFGTAWCFYHEPTLKIVGNCHKLPDSQFSRHLCSIDDIVDAWATILPHAPRVIFTVSPVRHLNDGLHGNTLSKSRLHLAIEQLCKDFDNAEYFPAFEALNDDLRDYRFYADDLKHPSTVAEEYIFNLFVEQYFDSAAAVQIERNRKESLRGLHRPIII